MILFAVGHVIKQNGGLRADIFRKVFLLLAFAARDDIFQGKSCQKFIESDPK